MIGGPVYVGRRVPAASAPGIEPSLINPELPIDHRQADHRGATMGYWPAYDRISPGCRSAYLSWLAAGRPGGAYIGYPFIFFYGLERRVLVDRQRDPAIHAELPVLAAEVERLLILYSGNRSFRRYTTAFLDLLGVLSSREPLYSRERSTTEPPGLWPAQLHVAIAQLARDGKPVPAQWAAPWVRAHLGARLPMAARRCPEEFDSLFVRRYAKRYGKGVIVRAHIADLIVRYQPASGGFRDDVEVAVGSLPQVTESAPELAEMVRIVEECGIALASYCRWSRSARTHDAELIGRIHEWAEGRLGEAAEAVVGLDELFRSWPRPLAGDASTAEIAALVGILSGLDFGVEPNPRVGRGAKAPRRLALFRSARAGALPGPLPTLAATLVDMGAMVGVASKRSEWKRGVRSHLDRLESDGTLGLLDWPRIDARIAWREELPPTRLAMSRRLACVDMGQREEIARFCRVMDVDVAPQCGVPPSSTRRPASFELDHDRLRQRLAETEEVSSILAAVFGFDDEDESVPGTTGSMPFLGLDLALRAFAAVLVTRTCWTQSDLEIEASKAGVLTTGALDAINEVAICATGESLCELTADGVELNDVVRAELCA